MYEVGMWGSTPWRERDRMEVKERELDHGIFQVKEAD